jgi:hypothetical protein
VDEESGLVRQAEMGSVRNFVCGRA